MKAYRRRPPTHDELGNELMKQWGGNVAHFYGAWHIYENGLWRLRTESEVMRDLWQVQIDKKLEGIEPNQGRGSSIESYCRAHLTIPPDKLNMSDYFINLENGVFRIREQEFSDHERELYLTHQLPFRFDISARAPQWEAFVQNVLVRPDGTPDPELINLFQEMCAYCLSAETHHRVSFFLHGPTASGKSTLVNILTAVAGENEPINLEDLNNPYTLAKIAGKRLVTFSEPDTRTPLQDGAFKKLVSKDPVPARQIYGTPFSFVPKCKLVGSTNNMPRVLDRSGAVFSRIIIIPVIRVVPPEQRDPYLEERLKQELPGIFNWMMRGAGQLRMQGRFTVPKQTAAAIEEYQFENDIPRQWLEESADSSQPNATTPLNELHNDWQVWSANNGYQGMGKINFRKELNRMGFQHIKVNNIIQIRGLRIRSSRKIF